MAEKITTVRAEIAASVWKIAAVAGTVLVEDDPIIILESMKMEIPIMAPHAGTVVEILIEDDGRGIPAEARARLFARGERLDTDKPGTGLGLAIARDVAEIYGGSISLEESEDLGGLLVRLSLPAAEG